MGPESISNIRAGDRKNDVKFEFHGRTYVIRDRYVLAETAELARELIWNKYGYLLGTEDEVS